MVFRARNLTPTVDADTLRLFTLALEIPPKESPTFAFAKNLRLGPDPNGLPLRFAGIRLELRRTGGSNHLYFLGLIDLPMFEFLGKLDLG